MIKTTNLKNIKFFIKINPSTSIFLNTNILSNLEEMGMKQHYILMLLFLYSLIVILGGCFDLGDNQSNISKSLIGTWNDRDTWYRSYTFFENGTCMINGHIMGTYNITDNILTIYYPPKRTDTFQYYLNEFTQRLQLTNIVDGYIRVYEKQ